MGCEFRSRVFTGWIAFRWALAFFASLLPTPIEAGDQNEKELAAQVTIRRDTFGVPHILAQTEEAAAYGQGYAAAEDHCLTMARLYLQARGELAAQFGEQFAEDDFRVKQLHMPQGAAAGYAGMPPWVQRIVDGYAAGYSRYVAQHRALLPEWVKPATGIDILAHGRRVLLMEFSMDLRQLDQINGKVARRPASGAWDLAMGSNMWAIGKERSVSGKGLLLGNPHLSWAGSQIFWESQITVPGKINVCGTSLIGGPGVSIGFNESRRCLRAEPRSQGPPPLPL